MILSFFIGLILGGLAGSFLFAIGQVAIEKEAVKSSVIKLNGKYYRIEEM